MKESLIKKSIVILFFFSILLIGLYVFKDYGVHYDEYINQSAGDQNYQYIINVWHNHSIAATQPLPESGYRLLRGPLVETTLSFLQNTLDLSSPRDVILFRHLCCFMFFLIGVFVFYLLCDFYFHGWKISLLGCIFLILSPRIFANAFYDTYDIPLLSIYTLCMYTLLRLAHKKSPLNLFLHALSCALLISTRQIGLIMPAITFFLFFIDALKQPAIKVRIRSIIQLSLYTAALIILTTIFWPVLWRHPYINFMKMLDVSFNYHFPMTAFYFGHLTTRENLPWHYAPVWILITTPFLYLICFFVGLSLSIRSILKNSILYASKNTILIMLCLLIPLVVSKGKVYDSWRHLFFIYPAFLIFALTGLSALWEVIETKFRGQQCLNMQRLLITATVLMLSHTAYFMIKNHPFENVYFNGMAGKDMQEIKSKFDLDYWGLSYKQALEYILKTDQRKTILVSEDPDTPYIQNNLNILPDQDKKRIKEVSINQAEYFLTNYRGHPQEYPYPEYYSIKIGDAKILGVYKLNLDSLTK